MRGNRGDWIIQGVKGELYFRKPDIFAATYEPASAHAQCAPSLPPVEEIARVMWESDHEGSWDDIHANPTMTRRIYMGNAEAALAVFRQWSTVTSTNGGGA